MSSIVEISAVIFSCGYYLVSSYTEYQQIMQGYQSHGENAHQLYLELDTKEQQIGLFHKTK